MIICIWVLWAYLSHNPSREIPLQLGRFETKELCESVGGLWVNQKGRQYPYPVIFKCGAEDPFWGNDPSHPKRKEPR